jgi:hypothetical protein
LGKIKLVFKDLYVHKVYKSTKSSAFMIKKNKLENKILEGAVRRFQRTNPKDIEKPKKDRGRYILKVGEIRLLLDEDYFGCSGRRDYHLTILSPDGKVLECFNGSNGNYYPILEKMYSDVYKKCTEHTQREEEVEKRIKCRENEKRLRKLKRIL